MESTGSNRIVLGVVGAVGIVFISYLLFKNLGSKQRASAGSSHKKRKLSQLKQEKAAPSTKRQSQVNSKADEEGPSKKLDIEEDLNQTSFVILSGNGENQPASSRKSDRSSDESSYDVVEAEDVEERNGKSARERDLDESLLDEMEASGVEASSSSFYHSAEETLNKDPRERVEDVSNDSTMTEEFHSQSVSLSQKKARGAAASYKETKSQKSKADDDDRSTSITESELTVKSTSLDVKSASGDVDTSTTPSKYTTKTSIQLTNEQQETTTVNTKPRLTTISASNTPVKLDDRQEEEEGSAASSGGSVPTAMVEDRELNADEITAALTACQNSPMSVTTDQIDILVLLLKKKNATLQPTVLDSLVRVSAFTQNNPHLRNAGCESIVCNQVSENCKAILEHGLEDDTLLVGQTKVLTNLTMDPKVIPKLEACVSPLIEILIRDSVPESVQLSILRPLINLCSQDTFHQHYTPAIQRLYTLLDAGSYNVQLQSVKVLVNLSLNHSMVPYMLSAKAPESLLDLLDKPTHADVILRVLTMIGNLRGTIAALDMDQSSLPAMHKAESPKTMYTALCGVVKAPLLRNKVYRLTRHSEEDIRLQASKLYTLVTVVKK